MDKGQKQWDKLVELPQSYENNPSIAQRAIEEISKTKKAPKGAWFARWGMPVVAGLAAVTVLLGVGIPLYNKLSTPEIVYYAQNKIGYEEVETPRQVVTDNNLDILYFDNAAILTTKVATILKTDEIVYLEQNAMHLNDSGFFDQVILRSVVKQNAEFDFFGNFKDLTESQTISEVDVAYRLTEKLDIHNTQVLAKFSYENAEYFLDIVTEQDGLQQLEAYVAMLLG